MGLLRCNHLFIVSLQIPNSCQIVMQPLFYRSLFLIPRWDTVTWWHHQAVCVKSVDLSFNWPQFIFLQTLLWETQCSKQPLSHGEHFSTITHTVDLDFQCPLRITEGIIEHCGANRTWRYHCRVMSEINVKTKCSCWLWALCLASLSIYIYSPYEKAD